MSVSQQVADVSAQIGPLLAIIALFTAALSGTVQSEKTRDGGAHKGAKRRIVVLSISLSVVSAVSIISLLSLACAVIDAHGTRSWESAFWVFLLVYLLLIPLCLWQVIIAAGACRLREAP
jgi:lysylphosphatidylglycerol synthetase-like protein (DUF2156 family)